MRITKWGMGTVYATALLAAVVAVGLWWAGLGLWLPLPLLLPLFCAWFFRDPQRSPDRTNDVVLSPADGRVVSIDEMEEPSYLEGACVRIALFLSVFDVHVNRAPLAGTVEWKHYRPGKFLGAYKQAADAENERNSLGLVSHVRPARRLRLDQVVGAVARRIVCTIAPGDVVESGQRFGMIRFGSRAEVWLPRDEIGRICVSVGDRVRGGETVLADWKEIL